MKKRIIWAAIALMVVLSLNIFAFMPKSGQSALDALQFRSPKYGVSSEGVSIGEIQSYAGTPSYPLGSQIINGWNQFKTEYGNNWTLLIDKRSGLPSFCEGSGVPFVPGAGNSLALNDISLYLNADGQVDVDSLNSISRDFLVHFWDLLPVDCDSLSLNQEASGFYGDYLWYATYDYVYQGISVENAQVFFRVNNGNLVQFGAENVSPINLNTTPYLTSGDAQAVLGSYIGGFLSGDEIVEPGKLTIVPIAPGADINGYSGTIGSGISYQLVYTIIFKRQNVLGTWLAKIDAQTGELLLFEDDNRYGTVKGGVYHNTNLETYDTSHPFPNLQISVGSLIYYTNGAGYYSFQFNKTSSANLHYGKYVRITDCCANTDCTSTTQAILSTNTKQFHIDFGIFPNTLTDCFRPSTSPDGAGKQCRKDNLFSSECCESEGDGLAPQQHFTSIAYFGLYQWKSEM